MSYGPEMTGAAIKLTLALVLVLAILWGVQRWARRNLTPGSAGARGRLIRLLGSHYLGVKKSIAVVQVPGAVLVLGIGAEQITLLSCIDDPQEIEKIVRDEKPAAIGFGDQLQRLMKRSSKVEG